MREKGRVIGLRKESIYILKKNQIKKMMMWKIVERSKASVLYILDVDPRTVWRKKNIYCSEKYYFSFKNSNDKIKS